MTEVQAQEQFVRLLDEHRGILFKVASAYCRNTGDRQDLVQTIAMEAWRAYPRFEHTRRFSTWLYRVALNVAITFYRAQQRRTKRFVSFDENRFQVIGVRQPGDDERLDVLQRLIERLNEFDRALILLHLDGESYAAIADILGISQTNVATKLSRIKQRLRRQATDAQNA